MKYIWITLFCASQIMAQQPLTGNPADLPFTLTLEEVTQDELPGFHSCAFAEWNGWWIIVGGRIGGLHGFFPITGFPENEANTSIWLINPATGDAHNFPIDVLTIPFPDQLKSTNPQFVQDGDKLFICGGYGKETASGNFITFPLLTAIQLPQLASALMNGTNPSAAIRQIQVPGLRVCGGEMDKLGAYFYLVGGHDFTGKYSDPNNGTFSQTYTNEIRKFKIQSTTTSLSISDYSVIHQEQHLHRRDFSLCPLVQPDGTFALGLYGGVFRPDAALPFYNPVYITENQPVGIDASYEQLFSQYTCPTVPLYNTSDSTMYTLFFAGLSTHYVDQSTQEIRYDERVPFIRDITTFCRKADGTSLEYVMPQKFDALLGTNMIFTLDANAPHFANEVLNLQQMTAKTFVGYLFGGIKAEIPNLTPSSASNRMFKVFVTPKPSTSTTDAYQMPLARVAPNPFGFETPIVLDLAESVSRAMLMDARGVRLLELDTDLTALNSHLSQLRSGIYFLQLSDGSRQQVIPLVKQ
jgi:hypothetical protein